MEDEMYVKKRNGKLEIVSFDKILKRIKKIGQEVNIKINYTSLAMKVIDQLYTEITTKQIDELSAEQCASMASIHPDYNVLAGRIIVSNHHKNTDDKFSKVITKLYKNNDKHNKHAPIITKDIYDFVLENQDQLNDLCDYERDYLIDYFGFKTLERAYLMRKDNVILERPQHMWLRVSLGIHKNNMEKVIETYHYMSQKYFTHATPTLFNAGTNHPQLSSCYLISMENDSIDGIYSTLRDCALISKWAGGIGLHIHNVRASGSHIRGTNGTSNGIVPMLRVFNNTAKYVDQCITPNTYIYTTKGPMLIENVYAGETEIYNSIGEKEVIKDVLEHSYQGEIYHIYTMHSVEPLKITGEHPVYVLNNQKRGINYSVITNRIKKKIIEPEWKDVKDLQNDDIMLYHVPSYEKDISHINEEDCYMYGILLGDGCMKNNIETGYISLHSTNKNHILEFCKTYFTTKCIHYAVDVDDNNTRIRWNKNTALPFRYTDIYDQNGEKHIHHSWLNLPLNKIQMIVKGLIVTDGCIHKEIVFDSTSRNLIESMKYMLLRMKILTSGYIRDRIGETHNTKKGMITNKKIGYCLRIPKTSEICDLLEIERENNSFEKFFIHENLLGTRIKKIETDEYSGTLYDLQMNEVHDYMVHNGIIHNGGGKRNGSFAIYMEPWHADIEMFLQMRKNHGDEELKARDLFYALWIPDLFMERVKNDEMWTLMCPDECPGLSDVYGDKFKELYTKYEEKNKGRTSVKARALWFQILDAQMETGTPYLLYKDACNNKSNQQNLGTIKSSNLCTEIVEYSDENESAVCNLASIALPAFVKQDASGNAVFDYEKLHEVTKVVTNNLNAVIDINFYPTDKTKRSNMRHRPIGIGVQGLADVFFMMNVSFISDEAKEINKLIFETIYHASLEQSYEIARERSDKLARLNEYDNFSDVISIEEDLELKSMINEFEEPLLSKHYRGAYSTFSGSPVSKGILQFDMWNVSPSERYNWSELKQNIKKYGVRNSLLVAPMPTASTSQILGYNECIEPITSNIYSRRTIAGEFVVANKYLMKELIDLNIWNEKIKNSIVANNGSIQQIETIPEEIRNKYKTVWEIPMRNLIDMAADRGAYICQSQSLNLWLEDPNYNSLTSMHFYSWNKGLKTGIYYLRRRARHHAQQFTIEPEKKNKKNEEQDEICEMCSA
jgi:ribonucleotide reductase alpha subunit